MIGAPIQRNRDWIIEDYLQHLYDIDYPKEDIHLAFFLNGAPIDNTSNFILKFKKDFESEYAAIDVWTMHDDRDDSGRLNRDFEHFAYIRNVWMCMRRIGDEYILSIDSDILVPPYILRQLLSRDVDIVGVPVINFEALGASQYNYMMKDGSKLDKNLEQIFESGYTRPDEFKEVDVIGACVLIKREVLTKGVHFGKHHQGEDIKFCTDAKKKGFKVFIDPEVHAVHFRRIEDYENYCNMQ